MKKKTTIISSVILALVLVLTFITFNGKEVIGESNKEKAGPTGNVVHSGTNGTVTWEIYENGHLLFKPTYGTEGTFDDIGEYYGNDPSYYQTYKDEVTSVSFQDTIYGNSTMNYFLMYFYNLVEVDLNGLDTSSVIDMSSMFFDLPALTSLDLGDRFDTSNVTNMSAMFATLHSLISLDLGDKFDTSNVTDMFGMFSGMGALTTLELGDKFDTSNVTNMGSMFYYIPKLTSLDLGDKFEIIYS